jgi:hypothetical protein
MARFRWKRVDSRTWVRTIEPSAGYMELADVGKPGSGPGAVYAISVHCERFALSLPGFVETSPTRAKRHASRDLAELRSALAGVGEDRCPF